MSLKPSLTSEKKQKIIGIAAITTIGVFILHGMTGWSVLNIQSPLLKPIEKKIEKPIEITLLNLEESPTPPPPPKKVEVQKPKPKQKQQPKRQKKPVAKAKPAAKAKPVRKPKVPVRQRKKPTTIKKEPVKQTPKPVTTSKQTLQPKKVITTDNSNKQKQKQWEIEQARIAEQQNKADAEAKRLADLEAKRKADAEAKRLADLEAKRKAKADAERLADLKAKRKAAAAAAAANKTYNFSASQASWRKKPKAIFPQKAKKTIASGTTLTVGLLLMVDKQGNVTSVSITKASGNDLIDSVAKSSAKRGKLNPFKKNGVPVKGKVKINLIYDKQ